MWFLVDGISSSSKGTEECTDQEVWWHEKTWHCWHGTGWDMMGFYGFFGCTMGDGDFTIVSLVTHGDLWSSWIKIHENMLRICERICCYLWYLWSYSPWKTCPKRCGTPCMVSRSKHDLHAWVERLNPKKSTKTEPGSRVVVFHIGGRVYNIVNIWSIRIHIWCLEDNLTVHIFKKILHYGKISSTIYWDGLGRHWTVYFTPLNSFKLHSETQLRVFICTLW